MAFAANYPLDKNDHFEDIYLFEKDVVYIVPNGRDQHIDTIGEALSISFDEIKQDEYCNKQSNSLHLRSDATGNTAEYEEILFNNGTNDWKLMFCDVAPGQIYDQSFSVIISPKYGKDVWEYTHVSDSRQNLAFCVDDGVSLVLDQIGQNGIPVD